VTLRELITILNESSDNITIEVSPVLTLSDVKELNIPGTELLIDLSLRSTPLEDKGRFVVYGRPPC
jgi:hypothetical protein